MASREAAAPPNMVPSMPGPGDRDGEPADLAVAELLRLGHPLAGLGLVVRLGPGRADPLDAGLARQLEARLLLGRVVLPVLVLLEEGEQLGVRRGREAV